MQKPLVSILIYNYNYGRFLSDCFESVLAQTYSNIEILFSDNASEDDSWKIALNYQSRFPNKIFVARNLRNLGTDANLRNCQANFRGKYYLILGSDDILSCRYVERAVSLLDSNPDVGFLMTHRYILDEFGKITHEQPFYNGSYKLCPPSQASVYMMSAINPSISQVIYRREIGLLAGVNVTGGFATQYYGTRISDFIISLSHPVIYLNEPLLGHRIHGKNQSLVAKSNLMEVIGPYVLNLQFLELARKFEFPSVQARYDLSVIKLSTLSLRYGMSALLSNDRILARRYLYLAVSFNPEIEASSAFISLKSYIESPELPSDFDFDEQLRPQRTVSYEPEPPFELIQNELGET